jgi:tellurite methyltransferase
MSDELGDRERWAARYAANTADERPPSEWVLAACERIPRHWLILDLAAGAGRNAIALARNGRTMVALDFVEEAVRRAAAASALVHGVVADMRWLPIRSGSIDAVVCTNFLVRPLFEDLKALLRPGGFLVYETYTLEHRALVEAGLARAPRSPDYLLQPGELLHLVAPLEIIDQREGHVRDTAGERYCASVVARKRTADSDK